MPPFTRVVPVTAHPPAVDTVPPLAIVTIPAPLTSEVPVSVCVPEAKRSSPAAPAVSVPLLVPVLRASSTPLVTTRFPPTARVGTTATPVETERVTVPCTLKTVGAPP